MYRLSETTLEARYLYMSSKSGYRFFLKICKKKFQLRTKIFPYIDNGIIGEILNFKYTPINYGVTVMAKRNHFDSLTFILIFLLYSIHSSSTFDTVVNNE